MSEDFPHEELSREIIGSGMEVLNELRPGLDEKLYENALVIELRERGMQVEQQKRYEVHYKGHLLGPLIPEHRRDLIHFSPDCANACLFLLHVWLRPIVSSIRGHDSRQ